MATHDEFFARVVNERRKLLGLAMPDVRARQGPSVPTQVEAEAGRLRENVQPGTFAKYDTALQWAPGSASAAYREGRQPISAAGDYRAFEPGVTTVPVALEDLLPLVEAQRRLHSATVADLADAVGRVDAAVSALIGPFVTDLLERNRGEKPHPLMEIAFGEALAVPVSPDDPHRDEGLYRRWLLGHAADLDDGTLQQFEERYKSRMQVKR